ncbi:MAG: riboflavin kinase [Bacillota bacterium]|nr:riboflavin kinase [Bacillota bacterium]
MQHIRSSDLHDFQGIGPCCLALGHFDGMHRGHLALAERLSAAAKAAGLASVLLSLDDSQGDLLSTEEEKAFLLRNSSLDFLLSWEAASLPPLHARAEWIQRVLLSVFDAKALVCGEEQRESLSGCELPLLCCPMCKDESGKILRRESLLCLLQAGDFPAYRELAGHAYILQGSIVHGAELGRKVGQPTANLSVPERKIQPPHGVYATLSRIRGELYMGLSNIGRRPSVDDFSYSTIETFLLDFSQDIYGEQELLELYFRVREVMKFNSLQEVQQQVQKDILQVRAHLEKIYISQLS